MDDKPAKPPAVKAGAAPKGVDIKAKLKKQAEMPPAEPKPEPKPAKKSKD